MDGKIGTIIGVSVPNVDAKIDAVIGVSIPQFLTRNETIIPSSFANHYLNDNLIFNSQTNTNSYIQFQNNNSVNNSFISEKLEVQT